MLGTFLRPAKGRKPPLRAKWDHCFESLLDGTLDVSRQPRRWWDDFLLLGVNARLLADTILATPEDRLFAQRGVFSAVCATCLSYLDDENLLRVSHALEILILIHQSVSRVPWTRGASLGVINVCAGGQASADAHFDGLIDGCANLAADHTLPVALRRLALRLLLVVCAAAPNVNQNALVGWFMVRDAYEPIMKILIAPVDVPGGGSDSATSGVATALARGPESFGKDEPRAETTTLDAFLSLGKAATEKDERERDVRRRERDVRLRDPHRLHLRLRVYLAVERRFASSSAHGRGARDDGRARTTSRGGGASPRAFAELARIVQRVRASTRSRGRRGDLRAPRRRLRARVHARGE